MKGRGEDLVIGNNNIQHARNIFLECLAPWREKILSIKVVFFFTNR